MSDMGAASRAISPVLDHVVINVMGKLDEAAAQYARLGFQLTERGHHTLGSSNNLAIFGTNYLELLGFLPGRETMRADLRAHPAGLTGLVFKSIDADLVYATMKDHGVPVQEPMSFARPVELPGGAQDARFKVIRVSGEEVQNGRTFFCHHDTPELVWRPEWQSHANGATEIVEFVIASQQPARTATLYERMFGPGLLTPTSGGEWLNSRRRDRADPRTGRRRRALRRRRADEPGRLGPNGGVDLQGEVAGCSARFIPRRRHSIPALPRRHHRVTSRCCERRSRVHRLMPTAPHDLVNARGTHGLVPSRWRQSATELAISINRRPAKGRATPCLAVTA